MSAASEYTGTNSHDAAQVFAEAAKAHRAGRLEIAAETYRRALALKPDLVEAWHNLGLALRGLGRIDDAAGAFEHAVTVRPRQTESHVSLGLVRLDQGRRADAAASFERAAAIQPQHVPAWMNLGNVRHLEGDLPAAAAAYRRVLALHPEFPDAHANLGAVLKDHGDLAGAADSLRRALALHPDHAGAWYALGGVLAGQGASVEAEQAYERAITLRPQEPEAHTNLANLRLGQGRLGAAEQGYRRVTALRPNSADAQMNLAKALQAQGRLHEAMDLFDQVAVLAPEHPEARDARLCGLSYRADVSAEGILAEHRQFSGARTTSASYRNTRDPDRRLRVGYVSGDLRRHPVGWFLSPVLAAHDPAQVEVFCYSNDERFDSVTERMRASAHHWREITACTDEEAAAQVAEDRIDVLVDLSGRTPGSRLSLFDLRPAPVQASWLGYASTTGRASIDYLVMDPWTAPAGAEAWCSEALVRLPFGRFCYGPPTDAPEPGPPPSIARGSVTFGSFNNLTKIGPETARLWAQVLATTPRSRLLLKWTAMEDPSVRSRITELFAEAGVAEGALELRGYSAHADMLAEYGDLDVGLDPFPFGGGLTTCEALWMGVPVVTWPQDRFASRQTLGFLAAAGLEDLAAGSAEAYVETAAALALDVERRRSLRGSLRARMTASPLCDASWFTPSLEAAFRRMWRGWCAGKAPAAFDVTSAEAGPRASPGPHRPPARA